MKSKTHVLNILHFLPGYWKKNRFCKILYVYISFLGIVSWGFGCAREGFPAVYANVHKYLDWITNHASSWNQQLIFIDYQIKIKSFFVPVFYIINKTWLKDIKNMCCSPMYMCIFNHGQCGPYIYKKNSWQQSLFCWSFFFITLNSFHEISLSTHKRYYN